MIYDIIMIHCEYFQQSFVYMLLSLIIVFLWIPAKRGYRTREAAN